MDWRKQHEYGTDEFYYYQQQPKKSSRKSSKSGTFQLFIIAPFLIAAYFIVSRYLPTSAGIGEKLLWIFITAIFIRVILMLIIRKLTGK